MKTCKAVCQRKEEVHFTPEIGIVQRICCPTSRLADKGPRRFLRLLLIAMSTLTSSCGRTCEAIWTKFGGELPLYLYYQRYQFQLSEATGSGKFLNTPFILENRRF